MGDADIRTLYISGLPPDARERELRNLFRFDKGFEGARLVFKGASPIGFALFSSSDAAASAMDLLNGELYDPADQEGARFSIKFAKTNLDLAKASKASAKMQMQQTQTGSTGQGQGNDHYNMYGSQMGYNREGAQQPDQLASINYALEQIANANMVAQNMQSMVAHMGGMANMG
eukprot:CAMPEP_0197855722 /NCGR_PEP_ID=MMETSP1438-20131217/27138_1 /TAXON_ID=1461541 /ORGANISM="Pterosperma sp., Strain CCMP1384" /LENGTH=173 /DNA_ID=CAMNT_0043470931 /DNA_START=219 /DNA_END=736 /DNA_ORIENTATION=-